MTHTRKYFDFGPYRTSINIKYNNIPLDADDDNFLGFCDYCNGYKLTGNWNGCEY